MKKILAIGLLLFFGAAQAVTIDFEQFADTVTTFEYADPVTVLNDGFVMSTPGHVQWMDEVFGPLPNTTEILLDGNVTFAKANGSVFDLISFDHAFPALGTWQVTLSAVRSGGSTVSLDLGLLTDGSYATYSASGLFSDIVSFSIQTAGGSPPMAIDNIVLNVVPIPAAVWLFGSALFGLGWFRRAS